MKTKFILPLLLAPLLIGCNQTPSNWIAVSSITVNGNTYESSFDGYYLIAKYKCLVPISDVTQVHYVRENNEQYIYAAYKTNKESTLSFPATCSFTYTCQKSHNDYTIDVSLDKAFGSFVTKDTVYINTSEKKLHLEHLIFEGKDATQGIYQELGGKVLYEALIDNNNKIMTDINADGIHFTHVHSDQYINL